MLFIGSMINLTIYFFSEREIRWSLDHLIVTEGHEEEEEVLDPSPPNILTLFSPTYQRNDYYVFTYDSDGQEVSMRTNRGSGVPARGVRESAESVRSLRPDYGRYGVFYYQKTAREDGGTVLALMNTTGIVYTRMRLTYISFAIGLTGLLVTFFLARMFSDRVVDTELENTRRQEQFITNASHELKTPLSVIRANTEMQELLGGENEWTQSTIRQVDRMDGLIRNLVMIAKTREQEDQNAVREHVDATAAVRESVASFETVAAKEGLTLTLDLEEGVALITDGAKLRQLTSILVDNAIKYCDEGGTVRVALETVHKGKSVRLTVSNDYREGESVDCKRFFDRFYRADTSHNTDRGGYGIGLSIAESICAQSGGSIRAEWKAGVISFICLLASRP